jgi:UDP-N-acetylmuramoyl-L-alanyl-D-glutamate--2,6-diaminopimelate ligase
MLKQLKAIIRKFIKTIFGENVFLLYHKILAHVAAIYYGNPSKKMLVIAVTGTKGKTSTINFLWHVLTAGGYKVGLVSTANIKIGDEEILNWYHMTMPGRFLLQSLLKKMLNAKCEIVLVEVTSEGIKYNRHVGLYYDMAVFTNIFPEHLKSHDNSFEKYKAAKGELFKNLATLPAKKDIKKVSVINADDKEAEYFNGFLADKKYTYGENKKSTHIVENILENNSGVSFQVRKSDELNEYNLKLLGKFNTLNAMPAIIIAEHLGIDKSKIQTGLTNCSVIPGRMEIINEGQNFTAIVDYAHEEFSMRAAVTAAMNAKKNKANKLMVVFGGDGGGREPRIGSCKVVSELANIAIVTLSDPFDTDPQIINTFLVNKLLEFKMPKENIYEYLDRRDGIVKAISLAADGDVILFACKGAEQSIIFKDKVVEWDDRRVVREEIIKLQNK